MQNMNFDDISVRCGAFPENTASIRVMEKAGMVREDFTEDIEYRGIMHHCVYYSIKANGPL